ncbi:MAG: hypothetical protein LAN62_12890, partial [Acidobacteriia bacterium]|nr:hypothetical protein [Terriglobia bacterium]
VGIGLGKKPRIKGVLHRRNVGVDDIVAHQVGKKMSANRAGFGSGSFAQEIPRAWQVVLRIMF